MSHSSASSFSDVWDVALENAEAARSMGDGGGAKDVGRGASMDRESTVPAARGVGAPPLRPAASAAARSDAASRSVARLRRSASAGQSASGGAPASTQSRVTSFWRRWSAVAKSSAPSRVRGGRSA